jgi:RecB family exonuclease
MRRVLRVQPPRERGLDPMLAGGIVHKTLERIAGEPGDPVTIFDEVFSEQTLGLTLGLRDEARRRWMRRVVVREAPEIRRQPVEAVEKEFHVPVGDGVELFGYVDRIDRYTAGQLVRDYKTGQAPLENNVQLDVYLLALDDPAGAVFERLKKGDAKGYVVEGLEDAVRGRVETVSRAQLEERRDRMRETARSVAAAIRAGRLALHPRDPESCTRGRCDGYDLCRVVRARWLAKPGRRPT